MKNTKQYDWHFYIPDYDIQVVVTKSSYWGAVEHLKNKLSYYNKPSPKLEFQFGQEVFKLKRFKNKINNS